ncbi:TSUP family transporter [Pelagicoccus albus]|uniref:Probable membrane transporter protein n=1 Tax=Pelagicoccus albus TaxID=415222 RepID=A0A7X1B7Z3_9BACT|nr:TSUP family transporter [Pelagicoccus albus]MBC2607330.1 TSUP family transporter [Pelagicoccus albus]
MESDFIFGLLLVLFLVAIAAGFIDTLAGGGGLIALPALLAVGIPPLAALGTNKLQGSVGTGTAAFLMFKTGRIQRADMLPLMGIAFLASASGSVAVQFVDVAVLELLIPIALVATAIFFIFSSASALGTSKSARRQTLFRRLAVPVIGAYDGMLGPGTGSFFSLAGVSLLGRDLPLATAGAKALNFATNIASLIVFLSYGKVVWVAGGVMILGQLLGAYLGSHCLFRINPNFLRLLVVGMCFAMLIRFGFTRDWW